jgi:hypothetical protein
MAGMSKQKTKLTPKQYKLSDADLAALRRIMRQLPAESPRTETAALRFAIHETERRMKQ